MCSPRVDTWIDPYVDRPYTATGNVLWPCLFSYLEIIHHEY